MAMYEREVLSPGSSPFGMVLIETGKTADAAVRTIVLRRGGRLGVKRVEWIDG